MNQESIQRLKSALETFVKEACQVISGIQLFYGGHMRARYVEEEVIGPHWLTQQEMRISIPALQSQFIRGSGPLASSDLVIDVLRSDPDLSTKLATPLEESEWLISEKRLRSDIWNAVLGPYLEKCLPRHSRAIFDGQVFDEVFEETIADVRAPGVETEVHLSPIANLRLTEPSIELEPGLKLRQLSAEDVEMWMNHSWLLPGQHLNLTDFIRVQCAVEATYHRSHDHFAVEGLLEKMRTSEEETERTRKVLGALRLLTNQRMHIAFTQKSRRGLLKRGLDIVLPQTPRPSTLAATFITLDSATSERLIKLWEGIQTSSVSGDVALPFSRWYGAADRLSDEDKLIDYWVGLESLFSPDSTQEVRFRVSLRIAAYLGETPDEWETIYDEMRHSYDWRSKVVHGGGLGDRRKLEKQGSLSAATAKTREYLRAAILKLLESDQSLSIKPGESEIKMLRRLGEK